VPVSASKSRARKKAWSSPAPNHCRSFRSAEVWLLVVPQRPHLPGVFRQLVAEPRRSTGCWRDRHVPECRSFGPQGRLCKRTVGLEPILAGRQGERRYAGQQGVSVGVRRRMSLTTVVPSPCGKKVRLRSFVSAASPPGDERRRRLPGPSLAKRPFLAKPPVTGPEAPNVFRCERPAAGTRTFHLPTSAAAHAAAGLLCRLS
jgi:hypothetical protein